MPKQSTTTISSKKLTPTARRVLAAQNKIASQTKIATEAIRNMKAATKANDLKVAVAAAKRLHAANDAAHKSAEEAGIYLTDTQLKALGYVGYKGGTWELPIPAEVCKALVSEEERKRRRISTPLKPAPNSPQCQCGCAKVERNHIIGWCVWCSHVYTDWSLLIQDQHFANYCPGAPEQAKQTALESLAKPRTKSKPAKKPKPR